MSGESQRIWFVWLQRTVISTPCRVAIKWLFPLGWVTVCGQVNHVSTQPTTKVNSAFRPCGVCKSSTGSVWLGLRWGAFTLSVRWQVTLRVLIWQVTLRSSEMDTARRAIPILYCSNISSSYSVTVSCAWYGCAGVRRSIMLANFCGRGLVSWENRRMKSLTHVTSDVTTVTTKNGRW